MEKYFNYIGANFREGFGRSSSLMLRRSSIWTSDNKQNAEMCEERRI